MEINKDYKKRIVENGLLINPSFFDSDLDTNVTMIPYHQNETKFNIYMDSNY